jgi:hypothetical protein
MSSAESIVAEAYSLLNVTDINETAPDPALMQKGLTVLARMMDAWAAHDLNVIDQTMTGDFTSGEYTIRLTSTGKLAPGMTVAGTGVAGRILSIDSRQQITLDTAHTQSGASASLAFTVFPLQARFEEGVQALLAMRLAPRTGDTPGPMVVQMAKDGWALLCANFMPVPSATYDTGVLDTTSVWRTSQQNIDGS